MTQPGTVPGYAPPRRLGWFVKRDKSLLPGQVEMEITEGTPDIVIGYIAQPDGGALGLTGHEPNVELNSPVLYQPGGASLTLTGQTPTLRNQRPILQRGVFYSANGGTVTNVSAGDLILAFAWGNSIPTPASGWTSELSFGDSYNTIRLASRVVTSGSTMPLGTWTNANGFIVAVYRYADGGVGETTINSGVSSTATWNSMVIDNRKDTSSIVALFCLGDSLLTSWSTSTGNGLARVMETDNDFGAYYQSPRTNTWAGDTAGVGINTAWVTVAVEIKR